MADIEYTSELVLRQIMARQNALLELATPRLEYAKRAALAELDPGPGFAALELKRVAPILIFLKKEDPLIESACRFLIRELLAAARFNVVAELELYGSKLILLFAENDEPTTSERFWESVRAIPFTKRLRQAAVVATVLIGIHDGFEFFQKTNPESKTPVCVSVKGPEGEISLDHWQRVFNAKSADEARSVIEAALALAVIGEGDTEEK